MSTLNIPAGTWMIDPSHSLVEFSIRHLGLAKVRGRFNQFSGSVAVAEDPLQSSVETTVDVASIDTNNADRDNHLRSPDFFNVEAHPQMTFRSSAVRDDGDGNYTLVGDLTIGGNTKPVELVLEFNGIANDPYGNTRMGFSAKGSINRSDFGIKFNVPLGADVLMLGEKVSIQLEIEAIKQ